jgi:hypothetical protein
MARDFHDHIKSAFSSPEDAGTGAGIRPVIFDIVGPDRTNSLLPDDLRMVLHVNPTTFSISRQKVIERIQTMGGWVEQHWGEQPATISLEASTGGFMRLYTGVVSSTGLPAEINALIRPTSMQASGDQVRSARRDTIAYDKYLDLLALFHNNGAIYDANGNVIMNGQVKLSFDHHIFWGWFESFSVSETAEQPYQFKLSANFIVERERHTLYSYGAQPTDYTYPNATYPDESSLWDSSTW